LDVGHWPIKRERIEREGERALRRLGEREINILIFQYPICPNWPAYHVANDARNGSIDLGQRPHHLSTIPPHTHTLSAGG